MGAVGAGSGAGVGRSSVRSIGSPHHITPASVATIRLANAPATGGRASQAQNRSSAATTPALPKACEALPDRDRSGAVCDAAPRASRRMAALTDVGGPMSASGACRSATCK